MRDQYKVLAEKYTLFVEAEEHQEDITPWALEKTSNWYKDLRKNLNSRFADRLINWFNNHGEQWALQFPGYQNYIADVPPGEDLYGGGFLDWWEEELIDEILNDWENEYDLDEYDRRKRSGKKLKYYVCDKMQEIMFTSGLNPWLAEQERLRIAALNKDNPGIEMDI